MLGRWLRPAYCASTSVTFERARHTASILFEPWAVGDAAEWEQNQAGRSSASRSGLRESFARPETAHFGGDGVSVHVNARYVGNRSLYTPKMQSRFNLAQKEGVLAAFRIRVTGCVPAPRVQHVSKEICQDVGSSSSPEWHQLGGGPEPHVSASAYIFSICSR